MYNQSALIMLALCLCTTFAHSRYFNQLAVVSSSITSGKLATVLAPSILQCSSASNEDLNLYTLILQILIDKAGDIGTTSIGDDTIPMPTSLARPQVETPVVHYDSTPTLSPTSELRSLCQRHTIHSAAASPGRIAIGKCVDSRLMEICSSTESLAATQSPVPRQLGSIEHEIADRKEKTKKKRKRRSSLSGKDFLINNFSQQAQQSSPV